MKDLVDDPTFRHLPPRERLARHAMNKIRDRLGWPITRSEYEELCRRCADGEMGAPVEAGLDLRDTYLAELAGKKVRVIWDTRHAAVVTVIRGWREQDVHVARHRPRPKWHAGGGRL